MSRGFRLGGDVELTALKAEMARKSERSLERAGDSDYRNQPGTRFQSGAEVVDTDQRSGPPARPSPGTLRPAVPAAPSCPAVEVAPPTRRGDGALVLPWPPSGNHAVKHTTAGAHYLRPEVAQYRRHVAALCVRLKPVVGRYRLHVHLSPPDARQRDMDNALKTINDALVRCGWLCDDSMVYMRELHVTVDDARQGSAIVRAEVLDGPRGAA